MPLVAPVAALTVASAPSAAPVASVTAARKAATKTAVTVLSIVARPAPTTSVDTTSVKAQGPVASKARRLAQPRACLLL